MLVPVQPGWTSPRLLSCLIAISDTRRITITRGMLVTAEEFDRICAADFFACIGSARYGGQAHSASEVGLGYTEARE